MHSREHHYGYCNISVNCTWLLQASAAISMLQQFIASNDNDGDVLDEDSLLEDSLLENTS